jgi:hypothetical protein
MSRVHIHQPPPEPVVTELMRAGLSMSTVLAMEPWKAREVLDLLHSAGLRDAHGEPTTPARGSI